MYRSIMKVSCRLIFRLAFSGPAMSRQTGRFTGRDEGGGGKFGNWELGIALFMLLSLGLSFCVSVSVSLSLITSNPAECYYY